MKLISNKIVGMVQVLGEMGHGLSEYWERENIWFITDAWSTLSRGDVVGTEPGSVQTCSWAVSRHLVSTLTP